MSCQVFPRDRDPVGPQWFPELLVPVRMAVRAPVDNSVGTLIGGGVGGEERCIISPYTVVWMALAQLDQVSFVLLVYTTLGVPVS